MFTVKIAVDQHCQIACGVQRYIWLIGQIVKGHSKCMLKNVTFGQRRLPSMLSYELCSLCRGFAGVGCVGRLQQKAHATWCGPMTLLQMLP